MSRSPRTTVTAMAVLMLAAVICLAAGVVAQQAHTAQLEIEGEPFVLNEFGAIIGAHDGTLEIEMVVLEAGDREPAYRKIELKSGDQILMINGRRAKSTADFEEIYNGLKVGEDITIALKRGRAREMITFPKGDPDKQGARIMVRTSADHGGGDITPIMGLGLLVSEDEGTVSVLDILPMPSEFRESVTFKTGDNIVSLQNQPVTSVSDFEARFGKIAVGDEVTLGIVRDGNSQTFTFAKPQAPEGEVMIKKQ